MIIKRVFELKKIVRSDKILIIYGPRQSGKTTLVETFLSTIVDKKVRYVTGNDFDVMEYLASQSLKKIKEFVSNYDMLVIDEAQKIPHIGETLKLIIDRVKNLEVIVTGSASFELAGQIGEPLTGRKRTIILYPISQLELLNMYNKSELKNKLEEFLIYGSYPEIVACENNVAEKKEILHELLSSYLLKDVLELEKVKSSKILWDLLKLIALQIGSEVSISELGNILDINKKTVARYLDLLEKAFVLYRVSGYSSNLRKEVSKKSKYFFYDIGVRNAVIGNFNNLDSRDDIGALWKNFLFMERIKKMSYTKKYGNVYFWRTWDQKEIDLVEERDGKLFGYEFKWNTKKKAKKPKLWLKTYDNAEHQIINPDNYLEFIV